MPTTEMTQPEVLTQLESIIDRLEIVAGRIYHQSYAIQEKLLWPSNVWCTDSEKSNPIWLIQRANNVITSLEKSKECLGWLLESVV